MEEIEVAAGGSRPSAGKGSRRKFVGRLIGQIPRQYLGFRSDLMCLHMTPNLALTRDFIGVEDRPAWALDPPLGAPVRVKAVAAEQNAFSGGPERVIDVIEKRAPDGFEKLDDVASPEELEAIVKGYSTLAGFEKTQVNK